MGLGSFYTVNICYLFKFNFIMFRGWQGWGWSMWASWSSLWHRLEQRTRLKARMESSLRTTQYLSKFFLSHSVSYLPNSIFIQPKFFNNLICLLFYILKCKQGSNFWSFIDFLSRVFRLFYNKSARKYLNIFPWIKIKLINISDVWLSLALDDDWIRSQKFSY